MNVRGLLVHLYRGGWAVYRPTTAAPLPDLLLDGSPPPDDEPGGILIMVKELFYLYSITLTLIK